MASSRLLPLHSVSPGTSALAGLASLGGLAFATLEGWPLWGYGLAAVLPWLPVFARDLAWIYRRYQWLALFYGLVVLQSGHLLEHVAQMIQIHLLGLAGADAGGIFAAFNIASVHFVWNTWVFQAVVVLLFRFGRNRWLRLAALLAGWHEVEHVYIFWVYLTTGLSDTPGLLSRGGALGGGLPISGPDLHFLYNLLELAPMLAGFLYQVQRAESPLGRSIGRGRE